MNECSHIKAILVNIPILSVALTNEMWQTDEKEAHSGALMELYQGVFLKILKKILIQCPLPSLSILSQDGRLIAAFWRLTVRDCDIIDETDRG